MHPTRTGKYSDHQRGERLNKRFITIPSRKNWQVFLCPHSGNSRNLISSVDYVVERAKESYANDSLPGYSLNCDKARSRLYETLTSRWYSTALLSLFCHCLL